MLLPLLLVLGGEKSLNPELLLKYLHSSYSRNEEEGAETVKMKTPKDKLFQGASKNKNCKTQEEAVENKNLGKTMLFKI